LLELQVVECVAWCQASMNYLIHWVCKLCELPVDLVVRCDIPGQFIWKHSTCNLQKWLCRITL